MGFSIPNPISAIKDTAEFVVDTGADAFETTVDFTETAVDVTTTAAVETFQFQASVTRLALEKSYDGARTVATTTVNVADRGIDILQDGFDRVTHPGDPTPPDAQGLTFAETKSASELAYKRNDLEAGHVYEFPDGTQWQVAEVSNNPRTGFRAVALQQLDESGYLPANPRTVLAFSGSDEGVDWLNNAGQGVGAPTPQYNEAVAFANKWKELEGNDVILTGHSLGGGLASYAAIKTDLHATAVNSAPLALNHLGFNPLDALRITQYYVPGEALSVLNAANPLDIRPGVNIAVQGEHSILDPRSIGNNHSLSSVVPDIPKPTKVE